MTYMLTGRVGYTGEFGHGPWTWVSNSPKITPVFTGRIGHQCIQHGPWTRVWFLDTHVHGPCPNLRNHYSSVRYTLSVSTGRVHGPWACVKNDVRAHGPCWIHWWPIRPVNTGVIFGHPYVHAPCPRPARHVNTGVILDTYRRGTAWRLKSAEILSAAAQRTKNHIWLKGLPFMWYKNIAVGSLD